MLNIKVAVVGARGYVGFELIRLIDQHPLTELVAAYSREYEGQLVSKIVTSFSDRQMCYCADSLQSLADKQLDVVFLALPNNIAAKYKQLWQEMSNKTCVIDLSADFRFDDTWIYAQPETCADKIIGQSLIANPGCYATASQLGLLPIIDMLDGVPNIFGISGYSGAGSKPSDKNNPEKLNDNLMAYKLVDHIHEREVSRVLGHEVYFMPHVASFFRGIHLTISVKLNISIEVDAIENIYSKFYKRYQLINVTADIPEVKDVQNTHHVNIGGFTMKNQHLVLCVTIDNLLKGAATQALQNMNLALCKQYDLEINTGLT
ncbi:MAG: N-acetyl-gamma-glutamyl-phosphate reductase [Alcanivoracaceae bacterium]|nr:N-acetyl-gamma-glutamyl-phosphate reductase [Alcanivoracaceae bacterium]